MLSGVVVWLSQDVFSNKENAPSGMGVRFEDMDAESRKVLIGTLGQLEDTSKE